MDENSVKELMSDSPKPARPFSFDVSFDAPLLSQKLAEEVTVDLQSLGISVMGHPDAIAFECPVELKTITTFEPSSYHRPGEKPILGFEKKKGPLWNLEKYLMQLGMYQIAMGGSGFLALVITDWSLNTFCPVISPAVVESARR